MDLILVCLTDKIKAEFLRFSFYQKGSIPMPLVTTTEMFKKAYDGGYAVGAFNVNNMEIVQGITEACQEQHAPVVLQVSKGARAYANHSAPGPRPGLRDLQGLHRRRFLLRYDRLLLPSVRRER